uniref:Uncharacterized protein n=1 Tax=viral metagenome TaxID=1070528 RepID=A0A6C0DQD8_9ZZZZ
MSTEFAKEHLREHLVGLLVSPVADGFWSIHDSAKDLCDRNGQPDQILRTFQNMLTRIPEWSDSTLSTEVERILKVTNCKYMDDLLMGVFIAYMKSFASLHYRGSQSELKIEFERPSFAKFIHELYKHSARKMWQMAYYFKTVGVSSEQQARNRQDIEKIVTECMEQVIRSFLPWEAIAKKYFSEDDDVAQSASLPVHIQHAPEEPVKKAGSVPTQVKFEDDVPEPGSESDSESGSESGDDGRGELKVSEEVAEIEFEDMDKPEEPKKDVVDKEVEDDPLKEIEKKAGDTLVLNM